MNLTPRERAQRTSAAMLENDNASRGIGIELTEIDEAYAVMELTVEKRHCNGHGICHGGITYMLADTAFAFACNSRNQSTLAHHNLISYLAPGKIGDRLRAEAREVSLVGRSGIYDVKVTTQTGTVIAEFRGMSRAIRGQYIEEI